MMVGTDLLKVWVDIDVVLRGMIEVSSPAVKKMRTKAALDCGNQSVRESDLVA